MKQKIIQSTKPAISDLIKLAVTSDSQLWVDYDREVDVLYISFGKPQKADDSEHGTDGIIRRKKKSKMVGITVLNASRYTARH